MFNQQLADFFGFIMHHPVGGILEGDQAAILAEKLRRGISARVLQAGDREVRVTASIGVSEVQATDKNPGDILERADAALYEAKQSGRNRICVSRPQQTSRHIGHV